MILFVFVLLLAALTLISISIQKSYTKTPVKELKRRANKGDEVARALYVAVSYGTNLEVFLWIIIGLSAGSFFVALTGSLPSWLAVFGCAALLWVGFAWLPTSEVSGISQKAAQKLAPYLAKVLSWLYPLLNRISAFIQRHRQITVHSGLYQKEDLIELLDRQQHQPDNRMSAAELAVVKGALTYSEKLIHDVMTPRRVVKTVKHDDPVGPLLLNELHKSGFSRFPVIGEKPDEIIGILYLRDLINAKGGGQVRTFMKKPVYYVNEEKPLQHALQAFLRTKRHLFVVVNSFEEVVGIITIEDILEQVLGKQIVDEFDKYENLRAVAALQAAKDAKTHTHAPEETSNHPKADIKEPDSSNKLNKS